MLMFLLGLRGSLILVAWDEGGSSRLEWQWTREGSWAPGPGCSQGPCWVMDGHLRVCSQWPCPWNSTTVDCWHAAAAPFLALSKACRFCLLPLEKNDCWTDLGIGIQFPFGFWVYSKTHCKKNLTLKSKFGYGQPQILLTPLAGVRVPCLAAGGY